MKVKKIYKVKRSDSYYYIAECVDDTLIKRLDDDSVTMCKCNILLCDNRDDKFIFEYYNRVVLAYSDLILVTEDEIKLFYKYQNIYKGYDYYQGVIGINWAIY